MVRHARATLDAVKPRRPIDTRGFTFFAALRRLECQFRSAPRFGAAFHPAQEPVRLAQDPSLAFGASAFTSVSERGQGRPTRVSVGFFGAFGPHGPLPTHLTEYAYERKRHHGDGALIGFLDVFHHRLLALLFRAWANAQPTVCHDRADDDPFARRLGALIGLRWTGSDQMLSQVDYACLHSAVHFVGHTRHAEGLAKTLSACFGVSVEIQEFVGRWLRIPDQSCWHVPPSAAGDRAPTHQQIGVLGMSSRIGTEIWDQQSTFRVVLGPLSRAEFERFLPGETALADLTELVERYAGPELDWDLRLVLREPDRRAAVLGFEGQIGVTAHLAGGDGAVSANFQELVIDPQRMESTHVQPR